MALYECQCCFRYCDLCVLAQSGGSCAGKVKTEIIHFLANTFTLDKFRSQRQVLGTELALTDFDEAEMSVQSVLDFMAHAQSDNKSPALITLRAREGATLNLLRMYGKIHALLCFTPMQCACPTKHEAAHAPAKVHRYFKRFAACVSSSLAVSSQLHNERDALHRLNGTAYFVRCQSSRPSFAGAARPDHPANTRIYSKEGIQPEDILSGRTPPPSAFAFPGFSGLIDDLHTLEALREKEIPQDMVLRRPSLKGPKAGFTGGPRGFHRFGSNSSNR